mgnify:CR=1 FL=1
MPLTEKGRKATVSESITHTRPHPDAATPNIFFKAVSVHEARAMCEPRPESDERCVVVADG